MEEAGETPDIVLVMWTMAAAGSAGAAYRAAPWTEACPIYDLGSGSQICYKAE